jgi:hypothetical protein
VPRGSRSLALVLVAVSSVVLAGCGVSRLTYLSPRVPAGGAEYLHMYVAPEERGRTFPPTGVRVQVDGARLIVTAARGGIHGGISRIDTPDPVCARESGIVAVPLVPRTLRQEWGTDAFEVQIAVSDADVSLDPAQVTLVTGTGQTYRPVSVKASDRPARAWIVRFDTPCVPDASYDLRIDGVTSGATPVAVPPIHFAPVSTSAPFGP